MTMEFYCYHCDEIIPASQMTGDRHKKCLNWPHPMTLHPAYEKDAKAPLPGHGPNCGWHLDQYTHECDCGMIPNGNNSNG